MKILAIESSCDESAIAIVSSDKNVVFNRIFSQDHKRFNGVFPEIAAREHLKTLPYFLNEAREHFCEIDGIAVTIGPGLIGSLITGVMLARGLSFSLKKPLIPINHLEGHALSARFASNVEYPFLLLLISGGHSKIIFVKNIGVYQEIGTTRDDAFGEAFDKVATMLGLEYPGGPQIEEYAKSGNNKAFDFPIPMARENSCDFSLSGLKTAVRQRIKRLGNLNNQIICDICASFQECVAKIMEIKLQRAINLCYGLNGIVAAGGVAANQYIRSRLQNLSDNNNTKFYAPPPHLCTDNAIMIAWAAIERWQNNLVDFSNQDFEPKSRYPL